MKFQKGLGTQLLIRLLIPIVVFLSIAGMSAIQIQAGEPASVVEYSPEITTDYEKYEAVIRLLEQMRLEYNQVRREHSQKDLGKWEAYRRIFKQKQLPLLIEQSWLLDEIRRVTYPDEVWEKLDAETSIAFEDSLKADKESLKGLPTEATYSGLEELLRIDFDSLSGDFQDPTEDFTTYTEVDPGDDLSKTSTTITATNLPRNVDSWIYRSHTQDNSDFEYLFDFKWTADSSGIAGIVTLTDYVDDITDGGITYGFYALASKFYIVVYNAGGSDGSDSWDGWSLNTLYHLELERVTSTTLNLRIYEDDGGEKGNLLDTLSKTYSGGYIEQTMDYLMGTQSYNSGSSASISYELSNLDLQEGGVVAPTVVTNSATSVEETSATLSGNITATGGENCTARRFQWGTNTGVYADNWTETGDFGVGNFTHGVTGLTKGEGYYYVASANNSAGWGTGSEVFLITKPDPATSFQSTDNGTTWIALSWSNGTGMDYVEVRYDTGSAPSDNTSGSLGYWGSGTSANVTGLSASTTYHFTIFTHATENSQWSTADNNPNCQDTTDSVVINSPTVTTSAATLVEESTATLNGNITDTGGVDCDARGFDYDIDSGAPYANESTANGTFSTGAYTANITSLTEGELYYFRAKAHNTGNATWGYGSEMTFLTKPLPASSLNITSHSTNWQLLGWINGTGMDYVEVRIAEGATPPSDNTSGTLVYWGNGTSVNSTGLDPNTQYSYRVFTHATEGGLWSLADNNPDVTGTTDVGIPAVTTSAATGVTHNDATLNASITDDGGATCNVTWYWDTTDHGQTDAWAYSANYTGQSVGAISHAITDNLTASTLYYFIPKVINEAGTGWGTSANFTTTAVPEAEVPAVTTEAPAPIEVTFDLAQIFWVLGMLVIAFWRGDANDGVFSYCMAGVSAIAMGLSWRGVYDNGFGVAMSFAFIGVGFYCIMLAIWNVIAWIGRR